ncbi:ADP-ribosyl-(dinitrogen reductase) hydrolase [Acidithiobacillus ferrooxidans]|nr:ADP-ribosyl-(dinitrogen reductase) hydrolase [Acidithiobacillus ferrooxidans]
MFISDDVLKKLAERHHVESHEVSECLNNREGKLLKDTRQQHCTVPETYWFIAQTKKARWLKVVLMFVDGDPHIKSAFEPNEEEFRIYRKYGE